MKTRNAAANATAGTGRTVAGTRARSAARAAALGAALALLAGCGGDDDTPSTQNAPGAGDGTDVPVGTGPDGTPPTEDPPGVGEGDEPVSPPGAGSAPATGGDLDDRERLIVEIEPGTPIAGTASPWLVFVELFSRASRPSDGGFAYVSLIGYDGPAEFSTHVDFYDREYLDAPDSCFVRDLGGSGGGGDDDNPLQVDGGETLLLATSDGGSWGEIPRVEEPGNLYYDAVGTLPGTAPTDLTLTIPGAVFPAVADYPLLTPTPPVRLSPALDEPLTTTSVYRWEPGDGRGFVKLDFLAEADDGEFLGYPVTCYALDDGEFEPTAEAVEALVATPGTVTLRYSRVAARIELRDGIAFFLTNEIAE